MNACLMVLLRAASLTVLTSASAQAVDLLSVYRQAAATSPVLAQARALLEADRASQPIARAGLMPRLRTAAGIGWDNADITGFGSDLGLPVPIAKEIEKDYLGASFSVTLTQPIVNGQAWAALDAAGAQIRAGEAAVLAAEQDLILEVVERYFGVLRADADARVAASQRELLQSLLEQSEAALSVGSGDIISVHEAQARRDAAEAARIRADNEVRIARRRLERLTHEPVGSLADLGRIEPEGPNPDAIELWERAAAAHQPLLAQAREQLAWARSQVDVARRAHWPRVDLGAGYSYLKGALLPSVQSRLGQVTLSLALPLYEGGEISARADQAAAQAMASQHSLEALQDRVALETESAFLTLEDSVAQLRAAAQAADSARVSLEATRKGHEVGERSMIDLLTTIQDYESAQRSYHLALYSHVVVRVQLKAAAGVVNTRDIEAINSMLAPAGGETSP